MRRVKFGQKLFLIAIAKKNLYFVLKTIVEKFVFD